MHILWQDVRYALRMLRKNLGFSAIAILSLALGMGSNAAIFTVVNAVLRKPLPVKDISRLVEVDTIDTKTLVTADNLVKLGISYPNFQDFAREQQHFSGLSCIVGPLPVNGVLARFALAATSIDCTTRGLCAGEIEFGFLGASRPSGQENPA